MSSRPWYGGDLKYGLSWGQFPSDVNWWNEIYYMLPKYNGRTGHRLEIPIPTGTNRNEEMSNRFWASPNPTTHILIDIKFHTNSALTLCLRPTGAKVPVSWHMRCGVPSPVLTRTLVLFPQHWLDRDWSSRHLGLSDGWPWTSQQQPSGWVQTKPAGAHSTKCGYGCDGHLWD